MLSLFHFLHIRSLLYDYVRTFLLPPLIPVMTASSGFSDQWFSFLQPYAADRIFYLLPAIGPCLSYPAIATKMPLRAGRYHPGYTDMYNEPKVLSDLLSFEYILYKKWNRYHLSPETLQSQTNHHTLQVQQTRLHEFFFRGGSLHRCHVCKRILQDAVGPKRFSI